jgi:hypothetical protein
MTETAGPIPSVSSFDVRNAGPGNGNNEAAGPQYKPAPARGLVIADLEDLKRYASIWFASGLVRNARNAEAVFAVMAAGMELGMSPGAAVRVLKITERGQITIPGAAAVGMIRASGRCEYFRFGVLTENGNKIGWCEAKRCDDTEPMKREFTVADAQAAGLYRPRSPDSAWVKYENRMFQWRAVGYAVTDLFSDVLLGFYVTEAVDAQDLDAPAGITDETAKSVADKIVEQARNGLLANAGMPERAFNKSPGAPGPLASAQTAPPPFDDDKAKQEAASRPPPASAPPPAGVTETATPAKRKPGRPRKNPQPAPAPNPSPAPSQPPPPNAPRPAPAPASPVRQVTDPDPGGEVDRPMGQHGWSEFVDSVKAVATARGKGMRNASMVINAALARARFLNRPRKDIPQSFARRRWRTLRRTLSTLTTASYFRKNRRPNDRYRYRPGWSAGGGGRG